MFKFTKRIRIEFFTCIAFIISESTTTMTTLEMNPGFATQYPQTQPYELSYSRHERYSTHEESRQICIAVRGRLVVIDSLAKKNLISTMLGYESVHVDIFPNASNFHEWGQLYNGEISNEHNSICQ